MPYRTILAAIATVLFVAACARTEAVYLKNSGTGQVVQCGPYDNRSLKSAATAVREAQCIQDYKEQGFARVPYAS